MARVNLVLQHKRSHISSHTMSDRVDFQSAAIPRYLYSRCCTTAVKHYNFVLHLLFDNFGRAANITPATFMEQKKC